jgi:glycosyltransferase involved in cell wall biosynthesis
VRVAYVISRYPLVSHAFIRREVEELRALGVEVDTFTVRRTAADELVSSVDREEDARTYALRPVGPGTLLGAQIVMLATRPRGYIRAARTAWGGRFGGLEGAVWSFFYLVQGVLLARVLSQRGIRHVHAHHANVAADVARIAAKCLGITWSLSVHGPTEFSDIERFRPGDKAADADFVACISDFCRSQLLALVPLERWDRLRVVRLGVELPASPPAPAPDDGRLRVLSVGQLAERKGFTVLIDAVAALRDRGVNVEATIVGDGPARAELEGRIAARGLADAVTLAGALPHADTLARYAGADVMCLPSFAEGVPVVLMEAMARGRPVVATRIAGVPELVQDGVSGLLVTPGRSDELADALARLAADPSLREQLGAKARDKVAQDYEATRSARQLRDLFARTIE